MEISSVQSPVDCDPAELVERIRLGDTAAEAELVVHYSRPIEFVLRRHLRDTSLAADLRQEALIIALERLRADGLDDPAKLPGFLHNTAVNLARGEARRFYRRNTHVDGEALAAAAAVEPLMADQIDRERLARAIRRLLDELGQARDRQILRRFYLTEEPKESICAALEVSMAHFDRVLYRARHRFREILARELPDDMHPE